jgi:hypothetical protein
MTPPGPAPSAPGTARIEDLLLSAAVPFRPRESLVRNDEKQALLARLVWTRICDGRLGSPNESNQRRRPGGWPASVLPASLSALEARGRA